MHFVLYKYFELIKDRYYGLWLRECEEVKFVLAISVP